MSSHKLIQSRHVHAYIHGRGLVGKINAWFATTITRAIGSMWAAYLFVLIALISLPQAFNALMNGDTVTGVSWLSQSFLQLVLLPVVIVGQNVISAAQDARAQTDHDTLDAIHTINVQQLEILRILNKTTKSN